MKLLFLAMLFFPFVAQAFSMTWPVRCKLGKDCFVQNYVDHDATAGWSDFSCGALSYDTHDGTDIRLKNLQAMRVGGDVLAAAEGKVLRLRDGMEDISIKDLPAAALKDRECGNGVVVEHAEGYQTMYCHLKKDSIVVRAGEQVKAGQKLAQIGLSGNTEFPHLHFTVWKGKEKLDPFTAAPIAKSCAGKSTKSTKTLWQKPVAYVAPALLGDGIVDAVPEVKTMRDTPVHRVNIATTAPVIAYWVEVMGLRQGDHYTLTFYNPDDSIMATTTQAADGNKAVLFQFVGKKNRTPLPAGAYRAEFSLSREGKVLLRASREAMVK